MSKKVISLVLALMLTVAMVAVAAVGVSAGTDEEGRYEPSESTAVSRYYFYKPSSWDNTESKGLAGVYFWAGTDSVAWPGYVAYATDVANVYYADVPDDNGSLIWNNTVDGGDDMTQDIYPKSAQTVDIGLSGYEKGDSDYYDKDMDSFAGMIYVLDLTQTETDQGGKSKYKGEWFYYYGNCEYGTAVTKDALTIGDYYGKDGEFPTQIAADTTTTAAAEETTTSVEETSAAAGTYLKVNTVSNYFPASEAVYDESKKQVTITYNFSCSKAVLAADWTLTYDSNVLRLATDEDGNAVNTLATVSPVMAAKSGASLSFGSIDEDGYGSVSLSASDVSLYDFNDSNNVFAKLVFDVVADKSTETTVDMVVDSLIVSSLGEDGTTDSSQEVALVSNKVVSEDDKALAVDVNPSATLEEPASNSLVLTVTADSNYFTPASTAYYDATTEQITVTYEFKSDKKVLNTQWYLEYDPEVLTLAVSEDTSVSPAMTSSGTWAVNLNDKADGMGYVRFVASDLELYDFDETTAFATVTFDVNDISSVAPVETLVSLQVESLVVSEPDDEGQTDASKEITLVKNYEVMTDDAAASANVENGAPVLTPSTYVPATTAEPETTAVPETTTEVPGGDDTPATTAAVPVTSEPETSAPETTAESTTEPSTTEEPTTVDSETTTAAVTTVTDATSSGSGSSTADTVMTTTAADKGSSSSSDTSSSTGGTSTTNSSAVQTGESSLSLVILALLIAATGVMFVLRKRENLF